MVTPNGDGVNDEVGFHFQVVKVDGASPVEVFDPRHARAASASLSRASSGEHGGLRDGVGRSDEQGAVVPPGVYLARVRVDTDTEGARIGRAEIFRTIAVAY